VSSSLDAFIAGLPKAELHLHIEGTLESSLRETLAKRNGIALPPLPPFHDLTSFLVGYYQSMQVLRTEADFYDLALAYFRQARAQNVVYAEVFFDPQAHTSRGVPFAAVIGGLDRARADAASLGIEARLIMCFLRDLPPDSALTTLEQSLPYQDKIIGVGLDSDERDNPPLKFKEVFKRASAAGYRLTMHCDVDQADAVAHIWQCLDDIGVERIDHGVNCLESPALVARLAADRIGLTVCPVSNGWVTDSMKAPELRAMLAAGLLATVNSDDPAYFGAYVNENLAAVAREGSLTEGEVTRLARNSFEIAWLDPAERVDYQAQVDRYAAAQGAPLNRLTCTFSLFDGSGVELRQREGLQREAGSRSVR
jgi:adenine deaminase